MDPVYAKQPLRFTWADPYAVIEVGAPAPDEELQARVETLRTIYRELLARYGEALGLRDLMAPWGGCPDAPTHVRSFPDGAPLTVFLYAGPRQLQELALRIPAPGLPRARLHAWLDASGALHVTGSERLAEAEHYAGAAWGVPSLTAQELYLDQAWALVRMLQGERHRSSLLAYLEAWLRREAEFGMAVQVFGRTFDLAGDEEWSALEAEWQQTVHTEILGEEASQATAAPETPPR